MIFSGNFHSVGRQGYACNALQLFGVVFFVCFDGFFLFYFFLFLGGELGEVCPSPVISACLFCFTILIHKGGFFKICFFKRQQFSGVLKLHVKVGNYRYLI